MRTKLAVLIVLPMLSSATQVVALEPCKQDVTPMLYSRFRLTLTDETTTAHENSHGTLEVSKGGAASLMRTDQGDSGRARRFFVSGQLSQAQLRTLEDALEAATPFGSADTCLVFSPEEPGDATSLLGGSVITFYKFGEVFQPVVEFAVGHDSPSSGPNPTCSAEVKRLDRIVRQIANSLRKRREPFQCAPN